MRRSGCGPLRLLPLGRPAPFGLLAVLAGFDFPVSGKLELRPFPWRIPAAGGVMEHFAVGGPQRHGIPARGGRRCVIPGGGLFRHRAGGNRVGGHANGSSAGRLQISRRGRLPAPRATRAELLDVENERLHPRVPTRMRVGTRSPACAATAWGKGCGQFHSHCGCAKPTQNLIAPRTAAGYAKATAAGPARF